MEKAAKWIDATINILCAVLAGFVIYTAVFGVMTAVIQRGLVLGATLVVTFLQLIKKDIQKKSKITWISTVYFLFILAAVAMTIYIVATFKLTVERAGAYTQMDIIMSIAVFLVLIIAAQRSLGWPMIIISLVFLAYTLFGRYIPGSFGHRGYAISRIMPYLSLGTEGIFGTSHGRGIRRYRDLFGFWGGNGTVWDRRLLYNSGLRACGAQQGRIRQSIHRGLRADGYSIRAAP